MIRVANLSARQLDKQRKWLTVHQPKSATSRSFISNGSRQCATGVSKQDRFSRSLSFVSFCWFCFVFVAGATPYEPPNATTNHSFFCWCVAFALFVLKLLAYLFVNSWHVREARAGKGERKFATWRLTQTAMRGSDLATGECNRTIESKRLRKRSWWFTCMNDS